MDRKRTIRLAIALGVAVLLAGALIYTSFDAATEARQPSQLLAGAKPGKSYKLTAMWSSQSGSLLLWVWVLSIFSTAALLVTRRRQRELLPYATTVLGAIATFFCALLV